MALPPAAPRAPIHTREVVCCGYRRTDGLWDIEARMTDRRGYAVHNDFRTVDAGGLFHDMALRVTVDDTLLIHGIDACIDAGPHRICPSVTPNFQRLLGLRSSPDLVPICADASVACMDAPTWSNCSDSLQRRQSKPFIRFAAAFQGWMAQRDRRKSIPCHALSATGEVVEKYWPGSIGGLSRRPDRHNRAFANLGRNADFYPGCGPS